jgi:hypothetical protein
MVGTCVVERRGCGSGCGHVDEQGVEFHGTFQWRHVESMRLSAMRALSGPRKGTAWRAR